jgi:exodeoxyribonuclease V alpha subunit
MPADTASMLRYLSSRAIKGIGPKTAVKIIEEFGEDAFDVIENHPDWLASSIKGMSIKTALAASESFKEQTGIRSTMMFFRDYFGAATTVRIYKKWGNSSVDIAKKNPYRLCNEIEGIGFERADALAMGLGIHNESFDRIISGLKYVLNQNANQNGHTCWYARSDYLFRNNSSTMSLWVITIEISFISSRSNQRSSRDSRLIRRGVFSPSSRAKATITIRQMLPS